MLIAPRMVLDWPLGTHVHMSKPYLLQGILLQLFRPGISLLQPQV